MGVPKSWRSSSVCKTDGYAFDGPNPSTPTILYSTLAQLVEQSAVNRQVPGSNPGGGAMPGSPSGQWLEAVTLPFSRTFYGGSNPSPGTTYCPFAKSVLRQTPLKRPFGG